MNGLQWTAWDRIENNCTHQNTAIYKIAILKSLEPFDPFPIPRFLRTDPNGTIVIGQTTQMEQRRIAFIRGGSHSEGILWDKLVRYTAIKKKFPDYILAYCYAIIEDEERAKTVEKDLILKYIIEYGEPPILNCAISHRYDHTAWQKIGQA